MHRQFFFGISASHDFLMFLGFPAIISWYFWSCVSCITISFSCTSLTCRIPRSKQVMFRAKVSRCWRYSFKKSIKTLCILLVSVGYGPLPVTVGKQSWWWLLLWGGHSQSIYMYLSNNFHPSWQRPVILGLHLTFEPELHWGGRPALGLRSWSMLCL